MKKPAKILIFILSFWFLSFSLLVAPRTADAAVPTFDVGLNSKMDQLLVKTDTIIGQMNLLLCMIAGIHQKEVGPPPTSTCSTAGFGGSGGATTPGTGGGLGSILGGLGGNILNNAIGQITGQLGSALGGALGRSLGSIFPSGLFNFMPGGSTGIPDITSLPSIDSVMGGVANLFGRCDSFDCIAWNISKAMLSMFSKQVADWVKTGGIANNGTTVRQTLFVRDWDRYLLDAANTASSAFLEELDKTQLCEPFGSELKRIFGGGGGFGVGAVSGGGLGAGILAGSGGSTHLNGLLNCNLNSVTANFQPFFSNFHNGGWQTWSDLALPKNNPFGQFMIIAEKKQLAESRAVQAASNEAKASNGFLGVKQCGTYTPPIIDADTGESFTLQLPDCQIVTPGILVEAEMRKVLEAEVDQLNAADELDEILSVLLQQLLQGVLFSAGGLFSPTYTQTPTDPSPNFPNQPTPVPPPPTGQTGIVIISPWDDSYVTGTIQISAMATNLPNVSMVQFSASPGGNIGAPVTGFGTFQTSLDTSTLTEGSHTLLATALNASSTQIAQSGPITIIVDTTPPVVGIPTIDDNVNNVNGGNRQLRVTASDSNVRPGLTVVFYIGGQCVSSCAQARYDQQRYELNFNSRDYVNGTYNVTAKVTDRAGNSVTSGPLTIIINN